LLPWHWLVRSQLLPSLTASAEAEDFTAEAEDFTVAGFTAAPILGVITAGVVAVMDGTAAVAGTAVADIGAIRMGVDGTAVPIGMEIGHTGGATPGVTDSIAIAINNSMLNRTRDRNTIKTKETRINDC
jgi:hypothetical protein